MFIINIYIYVYIYIVQYLVLINHVCKWSSCAKGQGAKCKGQNHHQHQVVCRGMLQQHANLTTTTDQLKVSMGAVGVHDAAIIATFIKGKGGLRENALLAKDTHTRTCMVLPEACPTMLCIRLRFVKCILQLALYPEHCQTSTVRAQ